MPIGSVDSNHVTTLETHIDDQQYKIDAMALQQVQNERDLLEIQETWNKKTA